MNNESVTVLASHDGRIGVTRVSTLEEVERHVSGIEECVRVPAQNDVYLRVGLRQALVGRIADVREGDEDVRLVLLPHLSEE
jgi:hypothetical protein